MTQPRNPNALSGIPETAPPSEKGNPAFHKPPAWLSYVLGVVFVLDILPVLVLGFFMLELADNHAPDLPPGCSIMDPCPTTHDQWVRDCVIFFGSILFWIAFVYLIYRLLWACLDTRKSRSERLATIVICVVIMIALTLITLGGLTAWATFFQYVLEYFVAALIAACFPAYLAVRSRYLQYADTSLLS